ncbi:hypothetical protein JAO29_06275 [Edaphobacter sp. HDX4]
MAGEEIINLYERHADQWVQARLRAVDFYEKGWIDRFCALIPDSGLYWTVAVVLATPSQRTWPRRATLSSGWTPRQQ